MSLSSLPCAPGAAPSHKRSTCPSEIGSGGCCGCCPYTVAAARAKMIANRTFRLLTLRSERGAILLGRDETVADRDQHQRRGLAHGKRLLETGPVNRHRVHAEIQRRRDLPVRA